ncbi:MAG: ornithine aminomutase subunit alpha [Acholeplasmataceae bacterium]|nr:ornithine aminomutase subunit alpha [Acholeplasmataceae bacterium]
MKTRKDDYLERSKHLQNKTDQELKIYFYELLDKMLDPIIDLAYTYTSPSIERSVLLRMGFSSIEAKSIVDLILEQNLITHGAGHVIYKYAKLNHLDIRDAGLKLLESSDFKAIKEAFK